MGGGLGTGMSSSSFPSDLSSRWRRELGGIVVDFAGWPPDDSLSDITYTQAVLPGRRTFVEGTAYAKRGKKGDHPLAKLCNR
jgi:hypothetical protein